MRRSVLAVLSLSLPFLLAGCSTVLDKTHQEVTVETPGAMEALCTIENHDFKYKIRAPKTFVMTKSTEPLNVHCIAPGNREKTMVIEPVVSDAAFLNIGNGLAPGMLVDYKSAGLYNYPEIISVDFTDVPPKRMPLPAYQQLLNDNPMLMELEEFRPGRSALQRDRYDAIPELEKMQYEEAVEESGAVPVESSPYSIHDKAPVSSDYQGSSAFPPTLDPSYAAPTVLLPDAQD